MADMECNKTALQRRLLPGGAAEQLLMRAACGSEYDATPVASCCADMACREYSAAAAQQVSRRDAETR